MTPFQKVPNSKGFTHIFRVLSRFEVGRDHSFESARAKRRVSGLALRHIAVGGVARLFRADAREREREREMLSSLRWENSCVRDVGKIYERGRETARDVKRRRGRTPSRAAAFDGFVVARDMGVGAACYWISDELAQRVSETKCVTASMEEGEAVEEYKRDDERRGRYVAFGSFDGFTSYIWYSLVDYLIPSPSGSDFSADAVSISALTASTTYDNELTDDLVNAGNAMAAAQGLASEKIKLTSSNVIEWFFSNPEHIVLTKKVVFDALVYNPIWACGFIVIMALLRNESKEEIKAELKRDWLDLYVSNIIFWVPLNFVVYGVIPLDLRVASVYGFTILYVCGLSLWEENRNKKLQALAAKRVKNENNEQLNLVENEVLDVVRECVIK